MNDPPGLQDDLALAQKGGPETGIQRNFDATARQSTPALRHFLLTRI